MRKAIKLPALLLALIMVVGLLPTTHAYGATANQPISVVVNGHHVHFPDQQPIIVEDRVLVPVRGVFELLGFVVTWDDDTRMARLTRSDITVVIPADATSFVVNGVVIRPDVPQRVVNDRLLLPLRAVAESVGGVPTWNNDIRRATITTAQVSTTPTPTPTPAPTATPVPLLTAAPRFEGSVGFALGANALILGHSHPNSIFGGGWSHHNLNRNFATLTGTIGRLDGSGAGERTLRFIGDGQELARYTVSGYTFNPITVAVDVRNVTVLRIEVDAVGTDGVSVALGTPTLHPTQATAPIPTPRPSPTPTPGTTPQPLLTAAPRVDGSQGFGFGGNAYIHGVRYTGSIWGGGWSTHNLNSRFTTLTGVVGRQDGTGTDARTIRFTGDGVHLASFSVSGTGAPQNISVDVRGVHSLRIDIDSPGATGASIVLGNPVLHPTHHATPTPAPLLTAAPRVDGSTGFGFGGNAYIQGIRYSGAVWGGGWSTHNLTNRFTTLTGVIGRQDNSGTEARQIRFFGDGRHLQTFTVSGTGAPMGISVDVRNVSSLRIEIDQPGVNGASIVLGNAMLLTTGATATPTPTPPPPAATPAPLLTVAPRVAGSDGFGHAGPAIVNGQHHTNVIWNNTHLPGWSTHNLAGQFHTFTATVGRLDTSLNVEPREIRIVNHTNNEILARRMVDTTTQLSTLTADVRGVSVLRIEIDAPSNGVHAALVNPMLQVQAPLVQVATRTSGTFGTSGTTAHMNGTPHHNSLVGGGNSVHPLNNRFTRLYATIGNLDGVAGVAGVGTRTITFRGDHGQIIQQFNVYHGMAPRPIDINVAGVMNLTIEISSPDNNGVTAVLGNPTVR